MAYKYKARDLSYHQQGSYLGTYQSFFDLEQETIDFDSLESRYAESDFVLNDNALNRICDDVNTMQLYWSNDILYQLNTDNTTLNTRISNILHGQAPATWSSTVVYKQNDIVINDNKHYLCIKDLSAAGTPLTDTTYWVGFALKGETGQATYNLNYKGKFEWQANSYAVDDVVYIISGGDIKFYICKSPVTYEEPISPETDPEDNWDFFFTVPRASLKIYSSTPTTDNKVYAIKDSNNNNIDIKDANVVSPATPVSINVKSIMQQCMLNSTTNMVVAINNLVNTYNL